MAQNNVGKSHKLEPASQHVASPKWRAGRRARSMANSELDLERKNLAVLSPQREKNSSDFGPIFISTVGGAAIGSVGGPIGAVIGGAIGGVISAVSEGVISFGRKR